MIKKLEAVSGICPDCKIRQISIRESVHEIMRCSVCGGIIPNRTRLTGICMSESWDNLKEMWRK